MNNNCIDLQRIDLIKKSSLHDLTNFKYLENLIVRLGFNNEILNEQPSIVKENTGGLFIWQYPNQFSKYLTLIQQLNVHSYLEIGCRYGGTFILTCEYIQRISSLQRISSSSSCSAVAIDIIDSPVVEYCQTNPNTTFLRLDTRSDDFKMFMENKMFDLIFIDADHSYDGVKSDYELTRNHGKIFVFHDIINDACSGVVQFWKELRLNNMEEFDFFEFTEQYQDVWNDTNKTFLGIGVAIKKTTEPVN